MFELEQKIWLVPRDEKKREEIGGKQQPTATQLRYRLSNRCQLQLMSVRRITNKDCKNTDCTNKER